MTVVQLAVLWQYSVLLARVSQLHPGDQVKPRFVVTQSTPFYWPGCPSCILEMNPSSGRGLYPELHERTTVAVADLQRGI